VEKIQHQTRAQRAFTGSLNNSNPLMAKVTKNKYQLPIPFEKLISMDTDSSPTHWGKLENAVDFIAPQNTPVLAAAEGGSYVRQR
jgi:murein DD-endopeptidase MepM/ murein hydrolase activator NlpD